MDLNNSKLNEFRRRILNNSHLSRYHPSDIYRIKSSDWWLRSFLESREMDVDVATAVFIECLKWRINVGIHSIGLMEIRQLLETGFIYFHGNDLEGNRILWINFEKNGRGSDVSQRALIYWLERHVTDTENQSIALFLNFSKVSAQMVKTDFLRFLFHSLKYYFPQCLHQIYAFELPAAMCASWRVISGHLDPQISEMVETISRRNLNYYIPMDFIPKEFGGNDDFRFTLAELARSTGSPVAKARLQRMNKVNGSVKEDKSVKRRVKFDVDSEKRRNVAEATLFSRNIEWQSRGFLAVAPKRSLVLTYDPAKECAVYMVLQSTSSWFVYFNIGVNSRRRIEIEPESGVLQPTQRLVIKIEAIMDIPTPRKYKLDICAIRLRSPPDLDTISGISDVPVENPDDRVNFFYDCFVNPRQQRLADNHPHQPTVVGSSFDVMEDTDSERKLISRENLPLIVIMDISLIIAVILIYLFSS